MQDRIYHCPPNPTADGITVAEIIRRHGVLRYLWPFWSDRQHRLAVVVIAVPLALVAALLLWLDPNAMPTCVFSGFVGAMYTIYMVMPARLRLTTCGEARHFIGDMDEVLVTLGYGRSAHPDDPARHHYRVVKLWAWLEWSNLAEADIEFRVGPHEIVIDGPVLILRSMRLRILRRNGA
jgi:hypothetical protein